MRYTEHTPHPALTRHVRCIWVFEGAADAGPVQIQRIVPDGYPELVLHYGDMCREVRPCGALIGQSRFVFAGQISQPLLLMPGHGAAMIGIRLQPTGARALLGLSMQETTDVRIDLTQVWARDGTALIEAVGNARGVNARLRLVERFLLKRLAQVRSHDDDAVTRAVTLLQSSNGYISVDALADRCGLSARQLERRFLGEVGIPPRLLASIFRFQRVFDLLHQPDSGRWVSAAIGAGYFDQAHMIRDFKRFAGQPPTAFFSSLTGLSAAMIGGEAAMTTDRSHVR